MAIVLYKKGNAGKVRGIPCQLQVCNEFSYLHLLEEGWFYTPEEVAEAEIKKELEEKIQAAAALEEEIEEEIVEKIAEMEIVKTEDSVEEETVETEIELPEPALTEDETRTAAKEAGIGYWHTKSIDRLNKELLALNEEPENAE